MVMEATPSPQSVGREFVRQYYTLLNESPEYLHRFYNKLSSFVHGGLEAPHRELLPVVGQKQIHHRIQQLNFRDCHAKITQVDSQATLGNGVVVQVTGELSNGGAPMRRFTQTFVLASQSPKNYYVHNDIFRYQDMVFSDEEGSGSGRSEGEEEVEAGRGADAGAGAAYFPPPPSAFPAPAFPAPPAHSAALEAAALNGHPPLAHPAPPHSPAPAPHVPPAHNMHVISGAEETEAEVEMAEPEREPSPPPAPPTPPTPEPPVAAAPSEPKTYANLLKSGGGNATFAPAPAPAPAPGPASASAPAPASNPAPALDQRPRQPRGARDNSGGGGSRYADSQQVFVGGVPAGATEAELRALFARFGPVSEVRVHAKGHAPAYGFVTFESAAAAALCLAHRDHYLPAEDAGGTAVRLNVEGKKTRAAPPTSRRRPPAPFPPRYQQPPHPPHRR